MTHAVRVAGPFDFAVTPTTDEESRVIVRARERDGRAFEWLYRLHVGRVYAVCLRMTANARRAEDLTQRTFVTAWQKLPWFRGDSAFSSWLHRIAVNAFLADHRAEQRRTARVFGSEDPAQFEAPTPAAPPGTRLDLEQALATLPAQARAVFVLHDVEGWRHDEIAAELGVAVGTTKAQLHRARKLLQEALR